MSAERSRYGAWRLSAIHAVQQAASGFPAFRQMDDSEANVLVDAVLARVTAALENEYAPQYHQTAHPADAITKLFELRGHENLDLRRTYDG